jgi:hypothetical protein
MNIYEDEWAFWDDIAGKYLLKHAGTNNNANYLIESAGVYADLMVIERRKRRVVQIPNGELPRVSATAASLASPFLTEKPV